jgi:hypothetical protein
MPDLPQQTLMTKIENAKPDTGIAVKTISNKKEPIVILDEGKKVHDDVPVCKRPLGRVNGDKQLGMNEIVVEKDQYLLFLKE